MTTFEPDLVRVTGGPLVTGASLEAVQAVWRAHADLGLPWHYFSKETGSLTVAIDDLRIQRCPLTWAELEQLMPDLAASLRQPDEGADHPVARLGWEQAQAVAEAAAERSGLPLRLLTEWEWEHAARGREDREYPWGDRFDASCANLIEAGIGFSAPVGQFKDGASVDGLLDLAGNVDEWTASVYLPLPGAHWTVPTTETWSADTHVTRGGSWEHHRDLARCRRRHGLYRPWEGAGVRLAMTAPASSRVS